MKKYYLPQLTKLIVGLVLACWGGNVSAQIVLLSEDFEGLDLLDSDLASDDDDETDYTTVGPAGWTTDDRNTPVATNPERPEYQGWTFMDQTFWINQQGNQAGREDFLGFPANNTIAVADPDGHDDFINNDPNLFSAVMATPVIDLTQFNPERVQIQYNSSWVPEDLQEVDFNVVIDGNRTTLFTWDSVEGPNFKPSATNELVTEIVTIPQGAQEIQFEWDMVEAGNDWWWAVDNVNVTVPEFLELVVDEVSGDVQINNPSTGGSFEINYYEIKSNDASLSFTNWNSLDDQNYDAMGAGIGQSWDEGAFSDDTELVEAYLLGSSVFEPSENICLGGAFRPGAAQDLEFFYAGPGGQLIPGVVRYTQGLDCEAPPTLGDFNNDGNWDCADIDALVAEIVNGTNNADFDMDGNGVIDGADLAAWLVEGGAQNPGATGGNPFLPGDGNLDGVVDGQDFIVWNGSKFEVTGAWCSGDFNADGNTDGQDFIIWNSNKFTSSDQISAVPEPAFGGITLAALVLVGLRRRAA